MEVHLIWAQDSNGGIGKDGKLPWHISEDLKNFKKITNNSTIIMGRKTWDSLPEAQRPLKERVNIVMSRDTNWSAEGAETALYVGRAIELAFAEGSDECWVIGGTQI